MALEILLTEISLVLNELKLSYLITGSLAYNVYTLPRATRDIDIIIELFEKDVPGFIKAIEGNFYFNQQSIYEEVKRRGMFNIIHLHSSYKVNLILRSNDIFEVEKFKRRRLIEVFNQQIYIITLEDLVISKLRWIQQMDSELHKRDIVTLLKNPDLDYQYIRDWCNRLELKTFDLFAL